METTNVQGYTVKHDEEAEKGVYHLEHVLSTNETESMFDNARSSGEVLFEDRVGRNYALKYEPVSEYIVEKR